MAEKKTKTSNVKKDSIKSLKSQIAKLKDTQKSLASEKEKLSEKNVRLLAEFDNYRRRTQDERIKIIKYAGEDLAKSILPILDDLHRTLDADSVSNAQTILEGLKLIVSKMDGVLEDHGISAFNSLGENFDSSLHEALMSEKSKEGKDVIIKEFEKGYKMNDKILRHAKVVVSK